VSSLEPREIILRLVQRALEIVPADRCTLTSLDQKVTEGFSMLGSRMAQITALLTPNAGSAQN